MVGKWVVIKDPFARTRYNSPPMYWVTGYDRHGLRIKVKPFGENSAPVKWLEEKAAKSLNGMNEKVVMPEEQVVYLLGQIFLEDRKKAN
jgi:hypothetical protein